MTRKEQIDLDENGVFTVGTIVRTYEIRSKGTFIEYLFMQNGKEYKGHQPVKLEVRQGECYMVKYSEKDPEHSMMILTEKKHCN